MDVGTAFVMDRGAILQSPERGVVDRGSFTIMSRKHVTTAFSCAQTPRKQSKECIEDHRLTSRVLGTREENARYEVQGVRHGRRMYKERECVVEHLNMYQIRK